MEWNLSRILSALVAVLSTLYLVALFLDWQHVSIGAGLVSVTADSGWGGWGVVAAIAAIGLVAYSLLEVAGYIEDEPGTEIAPVVMGLGLLVVTVARFTTIDNVDIGGLVTVERLWPATAGLVLAIAIAALVVTELVLRGPAFHRHDTGHPLSASR